MPKPMKEVKFIDMSFLPIYLGYCDSPKAWDKLMDELNVENAYGFCEKAGRCDSFENTKTNDVTIIVSMNRKLAKGHAIETIVGLIAHEATHAVDVIMESIGERNPSQEFKAYLTQYITQEGLVAFGYGDGE